MYFKTQCYKGIPLTLIKRNYTENEAKRFLINETMQNVWIPNKHLTKDGRIKEGENLDYVFRKAQKQLDYAGIYWAIPGIRRAYNSKEAGNMSNENKLFKVVVAGGRDFNDYPLLVSTMDHLLSNFTDKSKVVIISGGAKGADSLGERYAKEKGYALEVYPANWDKYGKSAGYKRNLQMAENATACVCFWDGKSKGTEHMINISKQSKLALRVINYNKEAK